MGATAALLLVLCAGLVRALSLGIHFLLPAVAQEIDHVIVEDFTFLVVSELLDVISEDVLRRGRQWRNRLVLGGHRAETESGVDEASWYVLHGCVEVGSLL